MPEDRKAYDRSSSMVSIGAAVVEDFLLVVEFNFRMISVKSITISVLPTVIFISSAPG